MLTQGTWRLRRTVGPPSSGALSVGTVLRFRRSERPGLHRDFQFRRYGGLFCAFNVFQRGLPWTSLRGRRNFGRHTAGAEERIRASAKRTPRSSQHCKPIFSPGRTPSCALRRMGRSVSVAEVYALEPQMATASSMKSKHAHCDVSMRAPARSPISKSKESIFCDGWP